MDPTNPVAGDTLRLECVVTGVPTPVVTWIKDDVSLSSSNPQISITINPEGMAVLSISSTSVEDSGVYVCNTTNIASNDFQTLNQRSEVRIHIYMHSQARTDIVSVSEIEASTDIVPVSEIDLDLTGKCMHIIIVSLPD